MAAPFSGEDFLKRSLFSSIFGLKVKAPKFHNTSQENNGQQQNFLFERNAVTLADLPSTSKNVPLSVYGTSQQIDYPTASTTAALEISSRERSLSEQLAETLLLASPISYSNEERQINSPRDIYEEIVEECAQIEQINGQQFDNMSPFFFPDVHNTSLSDRTHELFSQTEHPSPYDVTEYQNLNEECPSHTSQPFQTRSEIQQQICYCCKQTSNFTQEQDPPTTEKNIAKQSLFANGVVSLEEFVKLVIAVVKDAGALNKTEKKESPEEILRRKRQQNNEAAARYRKRQREAKLTASEEFDALTQRNFELRLEISTLQKEIETLKETFALKNEDS